MSWAERLDDGGGQVEPSRQVMQRHDDDDMISAEELNEEGTALFASKEYGRALEAFTRCLALQEQCLSEVDLASNLDVAATLNNLAMVYSALNRPSEALAHFFRSLSYENNVENDSEEIAQLHVHIGTILSMQGEFVDALDHFLDALAIEEKLSPQSADVAAIHGNIGLIHSELGNYRDSVKSLWRSIEVYQDLPPSSEVELELAATYFNLGQAYYKMEQFDDALVALCMNCLETREALAPNTSQLAETYDIVATVYAAQRRPDRVLDMLQKALPIVESCAPLSAELVQMYRKIAIVLETLGRHEEAAKMHAAADDAIARIAAASDSLSGADLSIDSADDANATVPANPTTTRKKKKKQQQVDGPLGGTTTRRYPNGGKGMRASKFFPSSGHDEKVNPVTMLTLFSLWKKLPHTSTATLTSSHNNTTRRKR